MTGADNDRVNDELPVFVVATETTWVRPSAEARRRRYLGMAGDLLASLVSQTPIGAAKTADNEPRWRVVLHEGESVVATSEWRADWSEIEAVKEHWEQRVRSQPPEVVREQAPRWDSG